MGRPLAALLSNDGARVFSVDIDSIQVILFVHFRNFRLLISFQEYTKRPHLDANSSEPEKTRRFHPRHVVRATTLTLQECLALSDVVITAVPSATYKVKTEWLKYGCVCLNVSADKNFEKDVREKVRQTYSLPFYWQ